MLLSIFYLKPCIVKNCQAVKKFVYSEQISIFQPDVLFITYHPLAHYKRMFECWYRAHGESIVLSVGIGFDLQTNYDSFHFHQEADLPQNTLSEEKLQSLKTLSFASICSSKLQSFFLTLDVRQQSLSRNSTCFMLVLSLSHSEFERRVWNFHFSPSHEVIENSTVTQKYESMKNQANSRIFRPMF